MRLFAKRGADPGSTAGTVKQPLDAKTDTNYNESSIWETIRLYQPGHSNVEKSDYADRGQGDFGKLPLDVASNEWKMQALLYDPFSAGLPRPAKEQGVTNQDLELVPRRRHTGSSTRAATIADVVRDLEVLAAEAAPRACGLSARSSLDRPSEG